MDRLKTLLTYIQKYRDLWGGEEKIYRKIFIPSPISIKMAFCTPYFEKYSPFVYRCPHLIARGKPKVHPLPKNISHLYE